MAQATRGVRKLINEIIIEFFSAYRFDRAAMKTMKKRLTLTDPSLPNLRLRHA